MYVTQQYTWLTQQNIFVAHTEKTAEFILCKNFKPLSIRGDR